MRFDSRLVLTLACLGAMPAFGCSGSDSTTGTDTANQTSIATKSSATVVSGVGNPFTVEFGQGEQSGTGSTFARPLKLGATYHDEMSYFTTKPSSIRVVMVVNTHKVFHGSVDTPKNRQTIQFDIARQSDGKYAGFLGRTVPLVGGFGDNDTILDSVDVAFLGEDPNDKWDSNLGKDYNVPLN